jgi:hypothetical protein
VLTTKIRHCRKQGGTFIVVNQPLSQLKSIDNRQDKLRTKLWDIRECFCSPHVRLAGLWYFGATTTEGQIPTLRTLFLFQIHKTLDLYSLPLHRRLLIYLPIRYSSQFRPKARCFQDWRDECVKGVWGRGLQWLIAAFPVSRLHTASLVLSNVQKFFLALFIDFQLKVGRAKLYLVFSMTSARSAASCWYILGNRHSLYSE